MPRAPAITGFPTHLQSSLLITSPPQPRSLLILFHGLGDIHSSLSSLGKNLNLPHTACISIKGPSPIPALFMGTQETGWHWGDDIQVDQGTGELEMDCGFEAASKVIGPVLKVVLQKDGLGFEPRDVFLWGFGQGGMVALGLADAMRIEMGGVISIGGALPASRSSMSQAISLLAPEIALEKDNSSKAKTPILLCGGNRHTAVTSNVLREVKERFEMVEYVKWEREGDGMARNREEMLPVMKFLARRLRMLTPVGTEEVGGVSRA